jgi:hypothetical protein
LCLIKGVGDGSSILVWEDPWIPSNLSKQPLVRLPDTEMNMVQELIDDHLNCWNSEKVIENFIPIDTAAICRIPIGDSWRIVGHGLTKRMVVFRCCRATDC